MLSIPTAAATGLTFARRSPTFMKPVDCRYRWCVYWLDGSLKDGLIAVSMTPAIFRSSFNVFYKMAHELFSTKKYPMNSLARINVATERSTSRHQSTTPNSNRLSVTTDQTIRVRRNQRRHEDVMVFFLVFSFNVIWRTCICKETRYTTTLLDYDHL